MSAGGFINTGYESNDGTVFPIQIQPETLTLTFDTVPNTAPATAPAAGLPSAKVSGSRRSIGVNARLVRFTITDTTPPPGYKAGGVLTLPILQATVFNGIAKGQVGTYELNGTSYDIAFVGKTPEAIV